MLLAGDEFGRTQQGNNNAYCQDNEISWLNWNIEEKGKALTRFVQKLTMLRCKYPILRYRRFLSGEFQGKAGVREVTWINPGGAQIAEEDWSNAGMHCFGMLLDGRAVALRNGEAGTFLLIMNSHFEDVPFVLPEAAFGAGWSLLIDTHQPDLAESPRFRVGETYTVKPRSFLLFNLETDQKQ